MSTLASIAIFYAIGAVIMGLVFVSFETVHFQVLGKPVRHPRLVGGIVVGIIWPLVVVQTLFGRLSPKNEK